MAPKSPTWGEQELLNKRVSQTASLSKKSNPPQPTYTHMFRILIYWAWPLQGYYAYADPSTYRTVLQF